MNIWTRAVQCGAAPDNANIIWLIYDPSRILSRIGVITEFFFINENQQGVRGIKSPFFMTRQCQAFFWVMRLYL